MKSLKLKGPWEPRIELIYICCLGEGLKSPQPWYGLKIAQMGLITDWLTVLALIGLQY